MTTHVVDASSCPGGGAFVTFVQRDEYAHLAWCLATQLQRVRSVCPLAVMYDARSLSPQRAPPVALLLVTAECLFEASELGGHCAERSCVGIRRLAASGTRRRWLDRPRLGRLIKRQCGLRMRPATPRGRLCRLLLDLEQMLRE